MRLFLSGFLAFFLLAFPVGAMAKDQVEEDRGDVLFSSLQGERFVVVVTGGRNDKLVSEQMDLFRETLKGLQARPITLVRFIEDKIFELSEFSRSNFRARKDMNANQQRYLEEQMHSENNEFTIVLIGIDGYWMQTWKGTVDEDGVYTPLEITVPPEMIYATVDRMMLLLGKK